MTKLYAVSGYVRRAPRRLSMRCVDNALLVIASLKAERAARAERAGEDIERWIEDETAKDPTFPLHLGLV